MSASRILTLVAIASFVLAATFFIITAKKQAPACGDVFARAGAEWDTTCETSK
jgi:hypothetical protein